MFKHHTVKEFGSVGRSGRQLHAPSALPQGNLSQYSDSSSSLDVVPRRKHLSSLAYRVLDVEPITRQSADSPILAHGIKNRNNLTEFDRI